MLAHSACLLLSLFAFAEEPKSAALLETLPPDGTWITYNGNIKINGQEALPTWTARSVGQTFAMGKMCRFIELEQTCDAPQVGNAIWRLVVPEDEFGEGKDPLGKAVKIWFKLEKNEPAEVESVQAQDPIFAMIIQGPKQNLKAEAAKEKINWQMGDLECSVISGKNELELGAAKFEMIHRVFRHKEVPFGLAGMHQDLKASFGGQPQTASIRMTLRDHGKDAKPKLPDLVP